MNEPIKKPPSLADVSIIAWLKENNIKTEKGEPLNFRDHPFLYDMYRDLAPFQAIMKPAQVGASTMMNVKPFWIMDKLGLDCIYTLPTDNDVSDFVGSKTNRMIVQNPYFAELTKDRDTVEQKSVGKSIIYYRGTFTKKAAMMVPADVLIHDEVDSCYEPGTEILTKKGWKKIEEVTKQDRCATLNQKDHRVVWQRPTALIVKEHQGDFFRFQGRSLDLGVTGNHKMWARKASHSGFPGAMLPYALHRADSLMGKKFVMTSVGRWLFFGDTETISIGRIQTIKCGKPFYYKPKSYPKKAFFRFLGWYLTEGCVGKVKTPKNRRRVSGAITITQKAEAECQDIIETIREMGYEPKRFKMKNGVSQIVFSDRHLALVLSKLGLSDEKFIPANFKYSDTDSLYEMLEAMMLGDGDDRNVITTTSARLADDIQEICLRLRRAATIHTLEVPSPNKRIYRVHVQRFSYKRFNGFRNSTTAATVKKVQYTGKVFCVTVPNGTLMVRGASKGKFPLWCGNSRQDVIADYETRLKHSKYKWRWYFSHPSTEGTGIHRLYLDTDQKHWFITCEGCKAEQVLTWPDSIDRTIEQYICKSCKQPISDDVRRYGVWKPTNPSLLKNNFGRSGYWVSSLMCPWVPANEIIEAYETKDPEYFSTKVLGLPYSGGGTKVTKEIILQNLTKHTNTQGGRIVIGVDTGIKIHYVVGNSEGLFFHNETDGYDAIEELLNRYKDSVVVIDQGGDLISPRKLREKYPGRVFLCYFRADRKTMQLVAWGEGNEDGKVICDRNRMIQLVVDEFTDKRLPLQGIESDWKMFTDHFGNMYRTKEDNALGVTVYKWQRSGADHLCFVAGTKILTGDGERSIEDVTTGDSIFTRKGYFPVKKVGMTSASAEVIEVEFTNGIVLVGTPEHPVVTKRGIVRLDSIRYWDIIETCQTNPLYSEELHSEDILNQKRGQTECTFPQTGQTGKMGLKASIKSFGCRRMAQSLKGWLSTTRTAIRSTILLPILSVCRGGITCRSTQRIGGMTQSIEKKLWSILLRFVLWLLPHSRTQSVQETGDATPNTSNQKTNNIHLFAWSARESLSVATPAGTVIVVPSVVQKLCDCGSRISILLGGFALFVGRSLWRIVGGVERPVVKNVQIRKYHKRNRKEAVYAIAVDGPPEFYANGVLVGNCLATVYWRVGMTKFSGGNGAVIGNGSNLVIPTYRGFTPGINGGQKVSEVRQYLFPEKSDEEDEDLI